MKRYPELDILRSLAVIGMIVYHAAFDLQVFYGVAINVNQGAWKIFQVTVASVFLLLVGISFAISYNRTTAAKRRFKVLKRGLLLLGCGMLVSIATYTADPDTYVRFGILHMIGVSILLLPIFVPLKRWNLGVAAILLVLSQWVSSMRIATSLLLPFGLMSPHFRTVDYFPLIPWFGVVLIGLVIGQTLYVDHLIWRKNLPSIKAESRTLEAALTFPGRYALIIYLLHQPILLTVLSIFL